MNGPTTLVDTAPACRGAHTAAHRRPRVPEVVVVAGTGGRVPARVPAGRLRLPRQRGDQLVAGVEPFLLVDAVVAVEDGAGLVAGQEHGDALGDAGADQVAGGGGSRRPASHGRRSHAARAPAPRPPTATLGEPDDRFASGSGVPAPRPRGRVGSVEQIHGERAQESLQVPDRPCVSNSQFSRRDAEAMQAFLWLWRRRLRPVPPGAGLSLVLDRPGRSLVGAGAWAAAIPGGCGQRGWRTRPRGGDRSGVILVHPLPVRCPRVVGGARRVARRLAPSQASATGSGLWRHPWRYGRLSGAGARRWRRRRGRAQWAAGGPGGARVWSARPAGCRVSSPVSPAGPSRRALTRWCVARGEGAARCAGRRCGPGGAARHAASPVRAAPDTPRAGRRPRAVPAR